MLKHIFKDIGETGVDTVFTILAFDFFVQLIIIIKLYSNMIETTFFYNFMPGITLYIIFFFCNK